LRATKVPRGVVLLYASAFLMAYEQVISFDNLYKGLKESCRNIRWKDSTVGYEGNALKIPIVCGKRCLTVRTK